MYEDSGFFGTYLSEWALCDFTTDMEMVKAPVYIARNQTNTRTHRSIVGTDVEADLRSSNDEGNEPHNASSP